MTYEQIMSFLALHCETVASIALDEAIHAERRALRATWGTEAARVARRGYAKEISLFLKNPRPIEPDDILCNRRTATAWAIALVMSRAQAAHNRAVKLSCIPSPSRFEE